MRASKLIALIYLLALIPEAHAHPGHVHSHDFMTKLLHAAETEWLAPLLIVIVLGIAGYFCLKYTSNGR